MVNGIIQSYLPENNGHIIVLQALSVDQMEIHFAELVDKYSWSTVRTDRCGVQFFWKHILKQDWHWLNIIRIPKVISLPGVLSASEVAQLINAARQLRYRVFILATYSMGLRLRETLSLQVCDIDGERHRVHIRRGKGTRIALFHSLM